MLAKPSLIDIILVYSMELSRGIIIKTLIYDIQTSYNINDIFCPFLKICKFAIEK